MLQEAGKTPEEWSALSATTVYADLLNGIRLIFNITSIKCHFRLWKHTLLLTWS